MKELIKALIILLIIYWLPFSFIWMDSIPKEKVDMLPHSDAVIVFGTLVRNGQVSPLLKEHLDASIAIYFSHRTKQIVVSNQSKAALIMKQYLIQNGIPAKHIAVDPSAERTPDTCRFEANKYPVERTLIFVSQGYHLPRISYQCQNLGVFAATFPAENIRNNRASLFSSFDVFLTRVMRYSREAGLTWLVVLGFYN